jgi:short subunit dehydrogenase-like uncharacterized protein
MKSFMIYGSYGYSGSLITERAVREGLKPLLAGRDEGRLREQAGRLGLEYRAFDLADTPALDAALRECGAVLHCAGPFVYTFRQMAEACLRTGRHYVDISGEIPGFEALAGMDEQAKAAGIMLLPGAGFDVVPSDCLCAYMKGRLPSATHLRLFLRGVGAGTSRGTAASGIENMERGAMVRREGRIERTRLAAKTPKVDFGRGPRLTALFNWGDVSTAWYSTGIPNIEVYFALPRRIIDFLHVVNWLMPVLRTRAAKNLLKSLLKLTPAGPSAEQRERGSAILQAEVTDEAGRRAVSRLRVPEGYLLTSLTAVEIMRRIAAGDFKPGFQTPSLAYGADFIMGFEGVERTDVE